LAYCQTRNIETGQCLFRVKTLGCASLEIPPIVRSPVNKPKTNSKHRRLALKKETVAHLTDDLLKQVIGGSEVDSPTQSFPVSKCCILVG
jgi:hypothetical protein